jgi:hypothetical protein
MLFTALKELRASQAAGFDDTDRTVHSRGEAVLDRGVAGMDGRVGEGIDAQRGKRFATIANDFPAGTPPPEVFPVLSGIRSFGRRGGWK